MSTGARCLRIMISTFALSSRLNCTSPLSRVVRYRPSYVITTSFILSRPPILRGGGMSPSTSVTFVDATPGRRTFSPPAFRFCFSVGNKMFFTRLNTIFSQVSKLGAIDLPLATEHTSEKCIIVLKTVPHRNTTTFRTSRILQKGDFQ